MRASHVHAAPELVAQEIARRVAMLPALDPTPLALPGDAWERRLLVALADHLPRQRWVARVAEQHLGVDLHLLAEAGAFGHPEAIPQQGEVPDLPGWSYFLHGRGCCLTHRDGTSIDVDFDEQGGDAIDPYFFRSYLQSLPAPGGVDALLRRPEPHQDGWMADLEGLHQLGFVQGGHRFRVTDSGLRWAEALGPAMREMAAAGDPGRRRQLALVMGDYWLAARIGEGDAGDALLELEREALAARATRLEQAIAARRDFHALAALADLGRNWAEGAVVRALEGEELDGLTSTALRIAQEWRDPIHHPLLVGLAQRATSATSPSPFLLTAALGIVMGAYRADTLPGSVRTVALACLREDAGASEAIAGLLHLLLDPGPGLARLARSLHHRVPMARHEGAACLAVLGTAEAVECLREAGTDEAIEALSLLRGEEPPPAPEPVGEIIEWRGRPRRVYRLAEVVAASSSGWMRSQIEEVNRLFGPLLERWWAS